MVKSSRNKYTFTVEKIHNTHHNKVTENTCSRRIFHVTRENKLAKDNVSVNTDVVEGR